MPRLDLNDFDGCGLSCRPRKGPWRHTRVWGECEHAVPPEPTVQLLGVFTAEDGEKSIGTTSFTVTEMADKVEAALRTVEVRLGPNALAILERGGTVGLSGGEYGAMALAVAQMLAGEA